MNYTSYVLLVKIIVLICFHGNLFSRANSDPLYHTIASYTNVKRTVVSSPPQIQGSLSGTPSDAVVGQSQLNVVSPGTVLPSGGKPATAFDQATGQATTVVTTQPAVQPSVLAAKPAQPAGQFASTIPQTTGQTPTLIKQSARPSAEDLEEEGAESCDNLDPEYEACCYRRHRRRRRHRGRHFRHSRGKQRLRPLDDDCLLYTSPSPRDA